MDEKLCPHGYDRRLVWCIWCEDPARMSGAAPAPTGFVEMSIAAPGATVSGEASGCFTTEASRPPELLSEPTTTTTEMPPVTRLADGFGDPTTLWNSRKWLQKALEAQGAKQIGAGIGCGQADIDILLEGCKFNVSIRPL